MITVIADGVFDGLHFGHIAHLQEARRLGDRLVVALATDEEVHQRKGPGHPHFPYSERAAMIRSLSLVDWIFPVGPGGTALDTFELISSMHPGVYVKGKEYENVDGHVQLRRVIELVESYGGRVAFVGDPLASSTEIIHEIGPLTGIAATLDLRRADVEAWLDKAKAVSPYLLGESIIDQYVYVQPQQKSPKEEIITYRITGHEKFPGGLQAISSHMDESTTAPHILADHSSIRKTRYVSMPFYRKVFSVVGDHEVAPYSVPVTLPEGLLVVGDYGHGLIRGKSQAREIGAKAKFLALMVQSNSLNWGYNLLIKWARADYFVVDEQELRLAKSDRWTPVMELLAEEHIRLKAKVSAVTLGHNGCLVHDGDRFFELPALTSRVVDRMGAGDAFFAWTAALAYVGAPIKVIALVGNIAGAIKVGTVGNKEPVTMAQVKRWVKGILP